jgi:hypothetical protein
MMNECSSSFGALARVRVSEQASTCARICVGLSVWPRQRVCAGVCVCTRSVCDAHARLRTHRQTPKLSVCRRSQEPADRKHRKRRRARTNGKRQSKERKKGRVSACVRRTYT